MPKDPGSIFGGLFNVCVSDEYLRERKILTEGVIFAFLGLVSSFVTAYVLSAAGLLL
ncbi:MAG: hypothetical protein JRN57_04815 [Nitrososphaerota archaeon]|nr:hypothetical protein [Nitrososphaerota archaeon]